MGADAALLIAAVLPNADLAYLLKSAAKLRLQILVEVHTVAGAHARHARTHALPLMCSTRDGAWRALSRRSACRVAVAASGGPTWAFAPV